MTGTLLVTAAAMGLVGVAHCATMCGLGCTGVARWSSAARQPAARAAWMAGRVLSYALAGALVASLAQVLRWSVDSAQWLRPMWVMLQLGLVVLGVTLLLRGRLPQAVLAWADRVGRRRLPAGSQRVRLPGEAKAFGVGLLWAGVPCGLLQAALLLSALASSPGEGALVMLVFALASLPGLVLGAAFWSRLPAQLRLRQNDGGSLALRVAGAGIALVSLWPFVHAAWLPLVQAFCL